MSVRHGRRLCDPLATQNGTQGRRRGGGGLGSFHRSRGLSRRRPRGVHKPSKNWWLDYPGLPPLPPSPYIKPWLTDIGAWGEGYPELDNHRDWLPAGSVGWIVQKLLIIFFRTWRLYRNSKKSESCGRKNIFLSCISLHFVLTAHQPLTAM